MKPYLKGLQFRDVVQMSVVATYQHLHQAEAKEQELIRQHNPQTFASVTIV
jgi:hypothetical protein